MLSAATIECCSKIAASLQSGCTRDGRIPGFTVHPRGSFSAPRPKGTNCTMTSLRQRSRLRTPALLAGGALFVTAVITGTAMPAAAATASNGPGVNAFWNEPHIQGFADAVSPSSKVWYSVGDGQLENVMYPQVDNPDTFGLQYYVTDGSTFTDNEVANTTHAISLADPTSLEWQQTNTAASGKYTITKTYV